MKPQSGGAVSDETESESEQETEQPKKSSTLLGSLDDLKALAIESGHTWGTGKPPSQSEETETETEEAATEETTEEIPATEETEEETEQAAAEETAEETEDGDQTSIEKQIKDLKDSGKFDAKLHWYLPRIAQETKQKNKYRQERDIALGRENAAIIRANELEAQLAETSDTRAVTPKNPLANVWDERGIEKFQDKAEEYLEWCEENPQGGECPWAKDENGDPLVFSEQDVKNFKRNTKRALRVNVPERVKFLKLRLAADDTARKIYPDYKDPDSAFARTAVQLVESFPALKEVPDIFIWIGHALTGRELAVKKLNGKAKESTSKKIIETKGKVAPTIVRPRGLAPRPQGTDLAQAKKRLEEARGKSAKEQEEAAMAYLEAKGIGGGGRARTIERVES